jgi:hypothetical protein
MKHAGEFITTETVILSTEEGGRTIPLPPAAYQGGFRPHIVLQPRETRQAKIEMRDGRKQIVDEYLGVAFWSGPHPVPISQPFTLVMVLMYAPHSAYDRVVPDAEFTIREGAKIVAHGRVLKRWTETKSEPVTRASAS